MSATSTTKRTVGWQRQLEDGNVEIFVKSENPRLKIRANASAEEANELLDWFEGRTGCAVDAPWRLRKGVKPMRGQLDLLQDQFGEAS